MKDMMHVDILSFPPEKLNFGHGLQPHTEWCHRFLNYFFLNIVDILTYIEPVHLQ